MECSLGDEHEVHMAHEYAGKHTNYHSRRHLINRQTEKPANKTTGDRIKGAKQPRLRMNQDKNVFDKAAKNEATSRRMLNQPPNTFWQPIAIAVQEKRLIFTPLQKSFIN